MDSDKVFAIVSHGVPGRVICADGTQMSANSVSGEDNNYSLAAWFASSALNNMKFAYYGACETAKTDSKYGNLLSYTTSTLGASCALGFYNIVSNSQATYYETKLFEYLAYGYSVNYSNSMSQTLTYNAYGSYGNVDSAKIYGSSTTTIK